MARTQIGGSFAPPLTDELLAKYRMLIDGVPAKTQLRDTLETLYACVAAWWEVDESTGPKRNAGPGPQQDLDQRVIDALWDVTPYPDEIPALKAICETVQQAESLANSQKRDAWRLAIMRLLWPQYIYNSQETVTAYYRAQRWAERNLPPAAAALVGLLFPDVPADIDSRWTAWDNAVKAALLSDTPPIPRPECADESLRTAATHLLHHVDELAHDREPATQSDLR